MLTPPPPYTYILLTAFLSLASALLNQICDSPLLNDLCIIPNNPPCCWPTYKHICYTHFVFVWCVIYFAYHLNGQTTVMRHQRCHKLKPTIAYVLSQPRMMISMGEVWLATHIPPPWALFSLKIDNIHPTVHTVIVEVLYKLNTGA